jgi:hypothetical protein
MAPAAPGPVLFQIHQVVPAFQMNMFNNTIQKKRAPLTNCRSSKSKGKNAINTKGVEGLSGQDAQSKRPLRGINRPRNGLELANTIDHKKKKLIGLPG